MKRIITILAVLVWSIGAFAQTAQEIVSRMEATMQTPEQYEKNGLAMTMEMKMPIVGTISSRALTKGDYMRVDVFKAGKTAAISWRDGKTDWTYDLEKNTIEITNITPATKDASKTDADIAMFEGVTKGYDVSIKKETADAWYIRCKKNKDNTEKDDPKTMELVVEKGTYKPLSLSAKVSIVSVTIRDLSYGVSDEQIIFHPENYPNATVIDKRQ